VFKYVLNPRQKGGSASPFSIVTALVDQIDFSGKMNSTEDIKISGILSSTPLIVMRYDSGNTGERRKWVTDLITVLGMLCEGWLYKKGVSTQGGVGVNAVHLKERETTPALLFES
jgi:hypothetical protein